MKPRQWELHTKSIWIAAKIKEIHDICTALGPDKESQDAAYFLSCGMSRLSVLLNKVNKEYHQNAIIEQAESTATDCRSSQA